MLPFNKLFIKKLDVWKSVYFCPNRTKHVINELYITHTSQWDNWAIIITTFTCNHKHLTTSYIDTTDLKIITDRYMLFLQDTFTLESTAKWQKSLLNLLETFNQRITYYTYFPLGLESDFLHYVLLSCKRRTASYNLILLYLIHSFLFFALYSNISFLACFLWFMLLP